jgi:hypothetical protein
MWIYLTLFSDSTKVPRELILKDPELAYIYKQKNVVRFIKYLIKGTTYAWLYLDHVQLVWKRTICVRVSSRMRIAALVHGGSDHCCRETVPSSRCICMALVARIGRDPGAILYRDMFWNQSCPRPNLGLHVTFWGYMNPTH